MPHRGRRRGGAATALLLVLLTLALLALDVAAAPGELRITRYVTGRGAGTTGAGDFTLAGTVGQAIAGQPAGGRGGAGFWAAETSNMTFLPAVDR